MNGRYKSRMEEIDRLYGKSTDGEAASTRSEPKQKKKAAAAAE